MRPTNTPGSSHLDETNTFIRMACVKNPRQTSPELLSTNSVDPFHDAPQPMDPLKKNQAIYNSICKVGLATGIVATTIGVVVVYTTLPIVPIYITAALILIFAFLVFAIFAMKQFAHETHYAMGMIESDVHSHTNPSDSSESGVPVCESEKYMELQCFH